MKAFLQNRDGINEKLKYGLYAEPALVPESPWLGKETPGKPEVTARLVEEGVDVRMSLSSGKSPWQWLVRTSSDDGWKTTIIPGSEGRHVVKAASGSEPTAVVVSAVSRLGREGRQSRAVVGKRD
jgi:hypothetical protein